MCGHSKGHWAVRLWHKQKGKVDFFVALFLKSHIRNYFMYISYTTEQLLLVYMNFDQFCQLPGQGNLFSFLCR